MQEALISCHCCNRCNEINFAYDSAMTAYQHLLLAMNVFDNHRNGVLNSTSTFTDYLRARIVLQQAIDCIKKSAASGLERTLARVKEDLHWGRIRDEVEVQIMKLNALASFELLETISTQCSLGHENLKATSEIMPHLLCDLDDSYRRAFGNSSLD